MEQEFTDLAASVEPKNTGPNYYWIFRNAQGIILDKENNMMKPFHETQNIQAVFTCYGYARCCQNKYSNTETG